MIKDSLKSSLYAGEIEGGADTVEYVIVLVIAVVIGSVLYLLATGTLNPVINNTGSKLNTMFNSITLS